MAKCLRTIAVLLANTVVLNASVAQMASAPVASATRVDVVPEARTAVAVVERFTEALATGRFDLVRRLLDPEVLILESGGAERSADEYLSGHAKDDAKFLGSARRMLLRRVARIHGDLAWVVSEADIRVLDDAKSASFSSVETMVLKRADDQWRIVHIHWSSRSR